MRRILLIVIAFSLTGCGVIYRSLDDSTPQEDAFVSDVLRNARKIIYVSPTGNDKANGSRHSPLASIQKAINIAQRGDAVKVEPGTYTENIRLRSGVSLVGSVPDKTVITSSSGTIITADNIAKLTVEGFTLDGGDIANHAFACDNKRNRAKSIVFRNNVVKNFTDNAIHLICFDGVIKNNIIKSIVGDGIYCNYGNPIIRGNEVSLSRIGIHLEANVKGIVEKNSVKATRQDGIQCHNGASPVVRNNVIIQAGEDGIECNNASSPIVRGNEIKSSRQNGIGCYCLVGVGITAPKIRYNKITENNEYGIYIDENSCPDIGREDDYGNNSIYENSKGEIYSKNNLEITAIGNWWGSPIPDANRFYGKINYAESLSTEP